MPKKNVTTHAISTGTLFKAAALVLGVLLFLKLWTIVASLFLAIIIAAAIEPTVAWLEKKKVPRVASVPGIYLLSLAALLGLFYAVLPSLFHEAFTLSRSLPEKYGAFLQNLFQSDALSELGFLVPALEELFANFQNQLGNIVPNLFSFISTIFGGIVSFFLVLTFSFYLSLRKNDIETFVLSLTPQRHRNYAKDLTRRIQRRTGRWLQSVFVLATMMGVATFVVLTLLDIPFALTLGVLAGLLEIVPYIGPFIAGTLIFLLASTESFALALVAVGSYILLQQLQQILIIPAVMSRVVGMNPLFVLVAIVVGAELAGLWGVIVAIPTLSALGEVMRDRKKAK